MPPSKKPAKEVRPIEEKQPPQYVDPRAQDTATENVANWFKGVFNICGRSSCCTSKQPYYDSKTWSEINSQISYIEQERRPKKPKLEPFKDDSEEEEKQTSPEKTSGRKDYLAQKQVVKNKLKNKSLKQVVRQESSSSESDESGDSEASGSSSGDSSDLSGISANENQIKSRLRSNNLSFDDDPGEYPKDLRKMKPTPK